MLFGPHNFLRFVRDIVTGGAPSEGVGFFRDVAQSAAAIGVGGASTRAGVSNALGADVIVLAANNDTAIMSFELPRDYDQDDDNLVINFRVKLISGTSIPVTIDQVNRQRGTTDLTSVAITAVGPTSLTVAGTVVTMTLTLADANKKAFQAGDRVYVRLIAGAPIGAGIAHVIGGRYTYKSDLVGWDKDSATFPRA